MTTYIREYRPGQPLYAPRRSSEQWEHHRELITMLYNDNISRSKIRDILSAQGFEVSTAQLVRKTKQWGLVGREPLSGANGMTEIFLFDDSSRPEDGLSLNDTIRVQDTNTNLTQPQPFERIGIATDVANVVQIVERSTTHGQAVLSLSLYGSKSNSGILSSTARDDHTTYPRIDVNLPDFEAAKQRNTTNDAHNSPRVSSPPMSAKSCRCADFFESGPDKVAKLLEEVTDLEAIVHPQCINKSSLKHFVATLIICRSQKPSQHLLKVLSSALETILTLLIESPRHNGVALVLAKTLALNYDRCAAVLPGRIGPLMVLRVSKLWELREDVVKASDSFPKAGSEEFERRKLAWGDRWLEAWADLPFGICSNVLRNNIDTLAERFRQSKTCSLRHDLSELESCFTEDAFTYFWQDVFHMLCSNLTCIDSEDFSSLDLEGRSLAQICLFYEAVARLLDHTISESIHKSPLEIDAAFALEKRLLRNIKELFGDFEYGFAGEMVTVKEEVRESLEKTKNHLRYILQLCDPNYAIFGQLPSVSQQMPSGSCWSWLDCVVEDFDDDKLQTRSIENNIPHETNSPSTAPSATTLNAVGVNDDMSMITTSSRGSFRMFRDLAYRIKFQASKISVNSMQSRWSGHMSVDSWKLNSSMEVSK